MENETSSNNIDFTPVIKELQILNQGVSYNGKRLDQINEYLLLKEKQENEEKEAQEKQAQEKAEQEAVESAQKSESDAQQTETYTELLTDIRDQTVLTNNLLSGQIFFIGVLFGVLLMNVLWNRFIR